MDAILKWGAKSDLRMRLVIALMWTAFAAFVVALCGPVIAFLLGWI